MFSSFDGKVVLEISVWFVKFFSLHLGLFDVAFACMQFYGDCDHLNLQV